MYSLTYLNALMVSVQSSDASSNKTGLLKVGSYLIDLASREVSHPDKDIQRISTKALAVLLLLVNQPGKTVTRETLFRQIWFDTTPTDDVLNQTITQLRRVFRDKGDDSKYIETIAKTGYRLLATVEWISGSESDVTHRKLNQTASQSMNGRKEFSMPGAHRQFTASLIFGFAALAFIAGVLYLKLETRNTKPLLPKQFAFQAITHRLGNETSPNLAPEGNLVAYSDRVFGENTSVIMVQATTQSPARQVSHPPPDYRDDLPVWSPDGQKLSFVRRSKTTCSILLVNASTGKERIAGDCFGGVAYAYDWKPDGTALVMGNLRKPREQSAPLRTFDVYSGRWSTLEYPIAAGTIDYHPHYSPDGRWVAFLRGSYLAELWKMPANGGAPRRLTQFKNRIFGWDWLPDGSGMIFNSKSGDSSLYRYDIKSGATHLLTRPGTVTAQPDIATRAPALAFQVKRRKTGIFRYALASESSGMQQQSTQILASSGNEITPAISPRGNRIAFFSDRSTQLQLWLGDLEDEDSLRAISGIVPDTTYPPVWSLDGLELLVIGETASRKQLYSVRFDSGKIQLLTIPAGEVVYAAFTEVPMQLMVLNDLGKGESRLVLYDRARQPWRPIGEIEDVAFARYSLQDKAVYFTKRSRPGLFRADPRLRNIKLVLNTKNIKQRRRWDANSSVFVYSPSSGACHAWSIRTNDSSAPACLESKRPVVSVPIIDPTGQWAYLTLSLSENIDIGFADLSNSKI